MNIKYTKVSKNTLINHNQLHSMIDDNNNNEDGFQDDFYSLNKDFDVQESISNFIQFQNLQIQQQNSLIISSKSLSNSSQVSTSKIYKKKNLVKSPQTTPPVLFSALYQEINKNYENPTKNHPKLFGKLILENHKQKFPTFKILKFPKSNQDINALINQPDIRRSANEYFESNQLFFDILKSNAEKKSQIIQSFKPYYQAFKNKKPLRRQAFH